MPKARRQTVPARQTPPRSNRRLVWIVAGVVLLVVSADWLWQTILKPRQLYHEAQQLLDDNPREAASLLEAAVNQSFGEYPDALCLWSRALLRQGQQVEALGCFSLISEPSSLPADQLLVLADEARSAGEVLLATHALQAIPEDSARCVEAFHRLMELKLEEGRFADVLSLGRKVLTRQPGLPLTALLMAQAHEQSLDPIAAVTAYETYLNTSDGERHEQVAFARQRLLQLALKLGRFDVARTCLDHLQKSGPLSPEAQLGHAELLRMDGQSDEAATIVSNVLQEEPSNLAAIILRATLAFDRRDDTAAEQDLLRVLKSQPWNKTAHYKLALVLQRSGRHDEGEIHFRENRRLTELSERVLALQKQASTNPEQETARLQEMQKLFDELGQSRMAEQLRRQLRAMPQKPAL